MHAPADPSSLPPNRFLAHLTERTASHLRWGLELVQLGAGQVVHEKGQPLSHLYFPIASSSVLGVYVAMGSGEMVEISTVGDEGFAGAELLFGSKSVLNTRICKSAGAFYRLPVEVFQKAMAESDELRLAAGAYLTRYMSTLARG